MKQSVKRKPNQQTARIKPVQSGTRTPEKQTETPIGSLRQIVRESLLNVLKDESASAAAKASAGRTLLEYFDDSETLASKGKRGVELSIADLDAEIARIGEV